MLDLPSALETFKTSVLLRLSFLCSHYGLDAYLDRSAVPERVQCFEDHHQSRNFTWAHPLFVDADSEALSFTVPLLPLAALTLSS